MPWCILNNSNTKSVTAGDTIELIKRYIDFIRLQNDGRILISPDNNVNGKRRGSGFYNE